MNAWLDCQFSFLISGVWNARPDILQRWSIFCNWFRKWTWYLGYRVSSICSCIQLFYTSWRQKLTIVLHCVVMKEEDTGCLQTSLHVFMHQMLSNLVLIRWDTSICFTESIGVSIIIHLNLSVHVCAGTISCKGNEIASKNYWKEGRARRSGGSLKLDLI